MLVLKKKEITKKLRSHFFLWLQTLNSVSCLDTYPQKALEHVQYAMCYMLFSNVRSLFLSCS